jgi:hypothetical protein
MASAATAGPLFAQTIAQDTHISSEPSIAPSTSADKKIKIPRDSSHDDTISLDDSEDEEDKASISSSILDYHQPRRPHHQHPPIPDLRFEQSYLASIKSADGVWWKIALITVKDQMLLPLLQGFGFNLVVFGWRRWNRGVRFAGSGVGARVRRWWWGVNNWGVPVEK